MNRKKGKEKRYRNRESNWTNRKTRKIEREDKKDKGSNTQMRREIKKKG